MVAASAWAAVHRGRYGGQDHPLLEHCHGGSCQLCRHRQPGDGTSTPACLPALSALPSRPCPACPVLPAASECYLTNCLTAGVQPDVEQERQRARVDARVQPEPDRRMAIPDHDQARNTLRCVRSLRGCGGTGEEPQNKWSGQHLSRSPAQGTPCGCCTWPCPQMAASSPPVRGTRPSVSGTYFQRPRPARPRRRSARSRGRTFGSIKKNGCWRLGSRSQEKL